MNKYIEVIYDRNGDYCRFHCHLCSQSYYDYDPEYSKKCNEHLQSEFHKNKWNDTRDVAIFRTADALERIACALEIIGDGLNRSKLLKI